MTESADKLTFEACDDFRREPIAGQIISLLTSEIEISPLVIDGDWGTGKTEFCTKLKHKLEQTSDYRAVYVDAFKADHADNPLMTILSAVLSLVDQEEKHELRKKALPVLRLGAKVAGKAVLSHLSRTDADTLLGDISRELDEVSDEVIDSAVRAMLKDHEDAEANIKALQGTLETVASDEPIVIFIDELDRCRPDFAVQMLELIKHTFDVTGLQFVLVTNMKQLKAAINHAYGAGVEAERYLDKFIKFRCVLPESYRRNGDPHQREREAAVEHLAATLSASKPLEGTKLVEGENRVTEFAKELTSRRSLSLREVEAFVRHLEIYHQLTQELSAEKYLGFTLIRVFAVFVYCFNTELSRKVLSRRVSESALIKGFCIDKVVDVDDSEFNRSTINIVAYFIVRDVEGSSFSSGAPEGFRDHLAQIEQHMFGVWGLDDRKPLHLLRETIMAFSLGAEA